MRTSALAVAALLAAVPLRAQEARRAPLLLVPRGDSVVLYLLAPPPAGGFVVYRARGDEPLARVTPRPVTRIADPDRIAETVGADLPAALQSVGARDAADLLRRVRSEPFTAAVASLLYRGVAVALGRTWADGGLTRGATYRYEVVFTDAGGRETAQRLSAQVVVSDVPPAAPGAAVVSSGDRATQVRWSYPRYAGDPRDAVIGFHVYRAEGSAPMRRVTVAPLLRDDAHPPSWRDTDVRNGATYAYQVTAVDVLGRESAPGAAAATTPVDRTPPASPEGLAVQVGDGVVRLVWRMSPEPDAAGYHVERATALTGPYARLTGALLPAGAPSWVDTTVSGAHAYFYRVVAADTAGNLSEPSNPISALPLDRTPPGPPTGLTATLRGRRLLLGWARSPSRDVQGYHVYRGAPAGAFVRLTSRPDTALAFTDSGFAGAGLAPGGHYRVRVTAQDSAGNESTPATLDVSVPDDEPPTPPSAFAARNVLGRYVDVTWSASGSPDVQWYVLTRGAGDTAQRELGRFDAAAREARDTAVVAGGRYVYRLVAVDSAGNRSGPAADTVAFRDFTPPASPRRVTAHREGTAVVVTWERVASADLAGYRVYRSSVPTGVFAPLTAALVSALTYTDAAAAGDVFYQVRAVDRSGNESAPSPVAAPGGGPR